MKSFLKDINNLYIINLKKKTLGVSQLAWFDKSIKRLWPACAATKHTTTVSSKPENANNDSCMHSHTYTQTHSCVQHFPYLCPSVFDSFSFSEFCQMSSVFYVSPMHCVHDANCFGFKTKCTSILRDLWL